jgi:hypothetical protein
MNVKRTMQRARYNKQMQRMRIFGTLCYERIAMREGEGALPEGASGTHGKRRIVYKRVILCVCYEYLRTARPGERARAARRASGGERRKDEGDATDPRLPGPFLTFWMTEYHACNDNGARRAALGGAVCTLGARRMAGGGRGLRARRSAGGGWRSALGGRRSAARPARSAFGVRRVAARPGAVGAARAKDEGRRGRRRTRATRPDPAKDEGATGATRRGRGRRASSTKECVDLDRAKRSPGLRRGFV